MRTLFIISILCGSVAALSVQPPLNDESQILDLEQQWTRALENEDRAALEAIVAPDFTFIEPDGSLSNRAAYLADRGNNPAEIHSFEVTGMQVKVFGESAVVTGLSTIDESLAGKRYRYQLRWKEMWVKRDGFWQVLAGQATPVNAVWNAPFAQSNNH